MLTKLTRIIQDGVSREEPVKHKQRKRLSATFYRKRNAKAWETRKRQARARAASLVDASTDVERAA